MEYRGTDPARVAELYDVYRKTHDETWVAYESAEQVARQRRADIKAAGPVYVPHKAVAKYYAWKAKQAAWREFGNMSA